MTTRSAKKLPVWPVALIIVCLLAALLLVGTASLPKFQIFGSAAETRSSQVIKSITREEQVVLLSLGIQGIDEKNDKGEILGVHIPGSERTSFIEYSFNAKLGIEGGDVEISQTGENKYLVSVPEFTFIGLDNQNVRFITEDNGILSWLTPEIDRVGMVNSILSVDAKNGYIDSNREILQDQASSFYTGIIASIDPAIDVEFSFRG